MTDRQEFTEPPQFDLSILTYDEFLRFLFDRKIVDDCIERDQYFFGGAVLFNADNPRQLVENLTTMFGSVKLLLSRFSAPQISQGLQELFDPMGPAVERILLSSNVPRANRQECFRSIGRMYTEVVVEWPEETIPSIFEMLWHAIGMEFWFEISRRLTSSLSSEDSQKLDDMFEVLREMLLSPHGLCQHFALHGLGHVRHPDGRRVIQEYMDRLGPDVSPSRRLWMEQCRDGTVM
ncbi:MAG: hypothetical protein LAP61_16715 [Acidobacteriia bacterium]|nr:hypothetical protein [Terriglobia bacterium]